MINIELCIEDEINDKFVKLANNIEEIVGFYGFELIKQDSIVELHKNMDNKIVIHMPVKIVIGELNFK